MNKVLTDEALSEIQARFDAATKGKWRWLGSLQGNRIFLAAMRPKDQGVGGWVAAMAFSRWGMSAAQPCFYDDKNGLLWKVSAVARCKDYPPHEIIDMKSSPNADLLGHAHDDIGDLLATIAALKKEIAEHAEWAKAFAADPANGAILHAQRTIAALKGEVERLTAT